jgi:hypothetical protein
VIDTGRAVCRGPRSPSPLGSDTRDLAQQIDGAVRLSRSRRRHGGRARLPFTSSARRRESRCSIVRQRRPLEAVRPPPTKHAGRMWPECGAPPQAAGLCPLPTHPHGRRTVEVRKRTFPIRHFGPLTPGNFLSQGVDNVEAVSLYTRSTARRRLGVRARLRSSSLRPVFRLPISVGCLRASTALGRTRGWGSPGPRAV